MQLQKFELPHTNGTIVADITLPGTTCNTLFLHGGGSAIKERFSNVRRFLTTNGIPTVAFDAIGHGESRGHLLHSSLKDRTNQAVRVVQKLKLQTPLKIIGTSMGSYTALKLSQIFPTSHLVLIVPGIYTPKVYDVAFGEAFSTIIRKENSWFDSDAWEIIKSFKGSLTIITAEKDEVIPSQIPEHLYNSSPLQNKQLITIKNAPHKIMPWLDNNRLELQKFQQLLLTKLIT